MRHTLGLFHGQGTYFWGNGEKYVGKIKNGKQNGQGTFTSLSHGIYKGVWKDGYLNQGTWTSLDNISKYKGEFKGWLPNGHGTKIVYENKYEGEWKNGKEHGHGTSKSHNGVMYEGEWKNGKEHGHGTINFLDGAIGRRANRSMGRL